MASEIVVEPMVHPAIQPLLRLRALAVEAHRTGTVTFHDEVFQICGQGYVYCNVVPQQVFRGVPAALIGKAIVDASDRLINLDFYGVIELIDEFLAQINPYPAPNPPARHQLTFWGGRINDILTADWVSDYLDDWHTFCLWAHMLKVKSGLPHHLPSEEIDRHLQAFYARAEAFSDDTLRQAVGCRFNFSFWQTTFARVLANPVVAAEPQLLGVGCSEAVDAARQCYHSYIAQELSHDWMNRGARGDEDPGAFGRAVRYGCMRSRFTVLKALGESDTLADMDSPPSELNELAAMIDRDFAAQGIWERRDKHRARPRLSLND